MSLSDDGESADVEVKRGDCSVVLFDRDDEEVMIDFDELDVDVDVDIDRVWFVCSDGDMEFSTALSFGRFDDI